MIWEQIDENPREVGQSGIGQRARSKPRNRLNSLLRWVLPLQPITDHWSDWAGAIGPERLGRSDWAGAIGLRRTTAGGRNRKYLGHHLNFQLLVPAHASDVSRAQVSSWRFLWKASFPETIFFLAH